MYYPESSDSDITVRVETRCLGGDRSTCFVRVAAEGITVAQLVRAKVAAEWALGGPVGRESAQPGAAASPWLSLDDAIRHALDAYRAGWYVVNVDGDQPSGLDSVVSVSPDSRVAFVRLFPLKGGLL
jgi:hypothetical protein